MNGFEIVVQNHGRTICYHIENNHINKEVYDIEGYLIPCLSAHFANTPERLRAINTLCKCSYKAYAVVGDQVIDFRKVLNF